MILALKLFLTPLFIALVSIAGRRWGPALSGWLIGLPLTSGPISLILALQNGVDFAARAATGNLGGQASVCVFCLAYHLTSRRWGWPGSSIVSMLTFLASVMIWNQFDLTLLASFGVLLLAIVLVARLIPRSTSLDKAVSLPAWDLPLRMVVATGFVVALTTGSAALGPQLSGLISPFPVFALVLAAFTHHQQGKEAASKLLRSYVIASFGYGLFFGMVGGLLPSLGIAWTYFLAVLAAVALNGLSLPRPHPQPG